MMYVSTVRVYSANTHRCNIGKTKTKIDVLGNTFAKTLEPVSCITKPEIVFKDLYNGEHIFEILNNHFL